MEDEIAVATKEAGTSTTPSDAPGGATPPPPQSSTPQSDEPPAKKPKLDNAKLFKAKTDGLAGKGRQPGTPRTPRIAREVSPANALPMMSARQMAKKEQETLKEEERRKRAENEEALKAQRKAARQAALEHKEDETRSAEVIVNQLVWAKLGTFHWWPAQVVDPDTIPPRLREGRKTETEVLTRFFGTYDYAWVERRTNVSDLDHKFNDRRKLTKKRAFLKALEEAQEYRQSGALPEAWTASAKEPEEERDEAHPEEAPEGNGHVQEATPKEATAAKERKRKGKAHVAEDSTKGERRTRQLRIMRHLGLAPPEGSPFTHETDLLTSVH